MTVAVSWRDFGIWRNRSLPGLLGSTPRVLLPGATPKADTQAVIGWGKRPSGLRAQRLARRHGLPCWLLEDGFIRSIGTGADGASLSLVVDDLGIYYDANHPSRLEAMIAEGCTPAQAERARALAAAWRAGRVSKYNHARELAPQAGGGDYVLVADQTAGDASITCGLADAGDFAHMLEAALDEHPSLPILLKVHPEVASGRKRGHFAGLTPGQAARVRLVAQAVHAPSLLEPAAAVYAVTSQLGFEGLLWGKPVRTFGMPFYAGWGLTKDERPAPSRRGQAPLDSLVHAALVRYVRYVDPETLQSCEVERVIDWMALQRRMRERFPPQVQAVGFSAWKKPIVRAYFSGSQVHFADHAPPEATLALWGRREAPAGHPADKIVRLEDGFLRSVGLGADLIRPLSLVQDALGLYYDASRPSGLEQLLATAEFDPALLARARALRERIVALGLTKYNIGNGNWQRPADGRRVVLVAGQVESDASLALGSPRVRGNMALLRAARAYAPEAWLVYKPHPDVVARLREPGDGEAGAHALCDEVVTDAPMGSLLQQIDELHVMTSLSGFEALLRGCPVVTHGQPFYAGWGLTEDRDPPPRRGRPLSLDALVAATLILYPSYVSRTTGRFTTPERVLDELRQWRATDAPSTWRRWWRRVKRAGLQQIAAVR